MDFLETLLEKLPMGKVISTNVSEEYSSFFILFLKLITIDYFFLKPLTNVTKQDSERRHKKWDSRQQNYHYLQKILLFTWKQKNLSSLFVKIS